MAYRKSLRVNHRILAGNKGIFEKKRRPLFPSLVRFTKSGFK
jgi:hypothetical protein